MYTFAVKTCAKLIVPNASVLPDQADYDYATIATYACNTGYELNSGDLVRTCQADKSWSDTTPSCTRTLLLLFCSLSVLYTQFRNT